MFSSFVWHFVLLFPFGSIRCKLLNTSVVSLGFVSSNSFFFLGAALAAAFPNMFPRFNICYIYYLLYDQIYSYFIGYFRDVPFSYSILFCLGWLNVNCLRCLSDLMFWIQLNAIWWAKVVMINRFSLRGWGMIVNCGWWFFYSIILDWCICNFRSNYYLRLLIPRLEHSWILRFNFLFLFGLLMETITLSGTYSLFIFFGIDDFWFFWFLLQ